MNAAHRFPAGLPPGGSPQPADGRGSDEYRSAFWTAMRNRGGHFSVQNALQIGTDSEGGYLVPDEYERTLVDALQEENKLRTLCKIIRTLPATARSRWWPPMARPAGSRRMARSPSPTTPSDRSPSGRIRSRP